jgi:hypothetical protein
MTLERRVVASYLKRYAMFRKLRDGSPIWVGAEDDLEKAMQKMRELAQKDGMEYFVHDFRTGANLSLSRETKEKPPHP